MAWYNNTALSGAYRTHVKVKFINFQSVACQRTGFEGPDFCGSHRRKLCVSPAATDCIRHHRRHIQSESSSNRIAPGKTIYSVVWKSWTSSTMKAMCLCRLSANWKSKFGHSISDGKSFLWIQRCRKSRIAEKHPAARPVSGCKYCFLLKIFSAWPALTTEEFTCSGVTLEQEQFFGFLDMTNSPKPVNQQRLLFGGVQKVIRVRIRSLIKFCNISTKVMNLPSSQTEKVFNFTKIIRYTSGRLF